jgi:hypothetical protein
MTSGITVWTKNISIGFLLALLSSCGIQGTPIPPENVPPETPVESTTPSGSSSKHETVGPTPIPGNGQGTGAGQTGVGTDKKNGGPGGTGEEDGSGGDDDGRGDDDGEDSP